jgi:tetratricopeptide (TPR) repeat protein
VDERVTRARLLYEQAVQRGDAALLAEADRELDAAEADLAVARGRVLHTRFLLGRDQGPVTSPDQPEAGRTHTIVAGPDSAGPFNSGPVNSGPGGIGAGDVSAGSTGAGIADTIDAGPDGADAVDVDAGDASGEQALFERAARLYRRLGDPRGEAEALFWIGCFHQVIRRDDATAVPLLERSLEMATAVDEPATRAEALRHLGIAAHRAGRLDEARSRLEEGTRLRRQAGQLTSAAANMVGLAYIAAAQDRVADAHALLDEAAAIATAHAASRILNQVNEASAAIAG